MAFTKELFKDREEHIFRWTKAFHTIVSESVSGKQPFLYCQFINLFFLMCQLCGKAASIVLK